MVMLYTALKSAEPPALEPRGNVMNARHGFVSLFVPAADDRNTMLVACLAVDGDNGPFGQPGQNTPPTQRRNPFSSA